MRRKTEQREAAVAMIFKGHCSAEIISATGLSKSLVCQIARSLNVKMPRPGCRRTTPMIRLTCDNCAEEIWRPERVYRAQRTRESKRRNVPVGKIGTFCSRKCFRAHQGWSQSEKAYLLANFSRFTHAQLAVRLGKSKWAVSVMCHNLGYKKVEKRWGTKDIQELLDLRERGWTTGEIATELDRSFNSVCGAISQYGLSKPRRRLTCEEKKRIARLHNRGHSYAVIADKLKVHWGMVRRFCVKRGLPSQLQLGRLRRRHFRPRNRKVKGFDTITLTDNQLLDLATSATESLRDADDYLAIAWEAIKAAHVNGESRTDTLIAVGKESVRKFNSEMYSHLSLDGFVDGDGRKLEFAEARRLPALR